MKKKRKINADDILDFKPLENSGVHAHDLTKATNDRLEKTVQALVLLSDTFSLESRKTNTAVKKLENTIKQLDEKNGRLQSAVFWLTVVTVIASVVQIYIAFEGK
jgi:hypothetical protein